MDSTSKPAAGWKRWTESEARSVLEELARSAEGVSEFARRKGITTTRIAYWKERLGKGVRPAFQSLELAKAPSPGAQIEIVSGDIVVRVREDIGSAQLAALLEVISRRVG